MATRFRDYDTEDNDKHISMISHTTKKSITLKMVTKMYDAEDGDKRSE